MSVVANKRKRQDAYAYLSFSYEKMGFWFAVHSSRRRELGRVGLKFLPILFTEWEAST